MTTPSKMIHPIASVYEYNCYSISYQLKYIASCMIQNGYSHALVQLLDSLYCYLLAIYSLHTRPHLLIKNNGNSHMYEHNYLKFVVIISWLVSNIYTVYTYYSQQIRLYVYLATAWHSYSLHSDAMQINLGSFLSYWVQF